MRIDAGIANASRLIALFRSGQAGLLPGLFNRIVIPDAVWKEVALDGWVDAASRELAAQNWPIREYVLPPDVPTLDEAGLKGFDADSVFGFYAPAGTPPAVIAKLNTEINRILATTTVKDKIAALGGEALPLTPAEFAAMALEDSRRFGTLIKERQITGNSDAKIARRLRAERESI